MYINPIMQYFVYDHLPQHLQDVSRPFFEVAQALNETLPDCEEKRVGLRKLLEAKDCMVRAALYEAPEYDVEPVVKGFDKNGHPVCRR